MSEPRDFDPSNIVVLPQYLGSVYTRINVLKKDSLPGELIDLQQNLYACVQVGRMDRAATLVRRIANIYHHTAPHVHDAHQRYLSGCLDSLLRSPSLEKLTTMQKWLELDMRARNVPIDHGVIATMVKATMATLVGSRLDRTVRRYITFARELGEETYYNTLSSSIFTAAEINKILKLFPQEFDAPSEELSEADMAELEEAQKGAHIIPSFADSRDPQNLMNFEPLPELNSVEQKGLGLDTLKQSLASLTAEYLDESMHSGDIQNSVRRQEKLEQDVMDAAMDRWRTESEDFQEYRTKGSLQHPPLGAQVHEWVKAMVAELKAGLKKADEPEKQHGDEDCYDIIVAAPFLKLMSLEKACVASIMAFFNNILDPRKARREVEDMSIPFVRFCEKMGLAVLNEAQLAKIQTHHLQRLSALPSAERHKRVTRLMKGKKWSPRTVGAEYAKITPELDDGIDDYNLHGIQTRLGAVMLDMFLRVAQITTPSIDPDTGKQTSKTQPVCVHGIDWRRGKRLGVLHIAQDLVELLQKEPISSVIAKPLPMIAPPKPWTDIKEGAYYKTPTSVVRFRDMGALQRSYFKLAYKRGDLRRVFAGLDVISKTPWRINTPLLRVMMEVWNSGKGLGKIVPRTLEITVPPKPDTDDPNFLNRWKQVCRLIRNDINSNHSQRCYQNFQLEIARAFSNTTFYCPQNCDFRGRAYPISSYFNHTGADHVRSLFMFAEGKELGETGLFWLKVQLANVYGYDKESLSARTAFVDEHIADIYDSANNPLNGKRWWVQAGHPYQCLAACMELKNALDSPIPTKFVSHLPIQQDGSCNGLQHYAALGGDEIGARQVNLSPGDKPADVYSAVAELVAGMVHEDAKNGHSLALALDGHVNRKMVKQPVMTNVYGVTYIGATMQVLKQLREIFPERKLSLDPNVTIFRLSAYIATCIFSALREMFNGAQSIQTWLGECGARISSAITPEQITRVRDRRRGGATGLQKEATQKFRKARVSNPKHVKVEDDTTFKSTIVWTTPLGMPVVQPYREHKSKIIKTHLQDIVLQTPTPNDPVSKRKQLQAFPPNFIHSLDATHMMLSALKCDEIGLAFGSVHDSFWTHANDVPTLNRVLRDAFVSMHRDDIVHRLKEEFEARYKDCLHWTSVKTQSPLGKKLTNYFKDSKKRRMQDIVKSTVTNGQQIQDLLEEFERQQLLASDDPTEQQRGREMVTPASIVAEECAADDEVYSTVEWGRNIGREPGLSPIQAVDPLSNSPTSHTPPAPSQTPVSMDDIFSPSSDPEPTTGSDADASEEETKADAQDAFGEDALAPSVNPLDTVASIANAGSGEASHPDAKRPKGAKPPQGSHYHRIYFWMPITFPQPPEKGKFDVTMLKESRYFFS